MTKNAENERIEELQRMIRNHNAAKGGSDYSEEIIRFAKRDLYDLTTPVETRLAEAKAALDRSLSRYDPGGSISLSLSNDVRRIEAEIAGKNSQTPEHRSSFPFPTAPPVQQGDTRKPRSPLDGSQHTGNQPYFDTNSDHMAMIDPLAPHWDLSGEFPTLVNPRKPGPKISNLG